MADTRCDVSSSMSTVICASAGHIGRVPTAKKKQIGVGAMRCTGQVVNVAHVN